MDEIADHARGHWHHILTQAGLPEETLTKQGTWCPIEGAGQDRFTFDDLEGRGTWHCRGCGGAGDGFSLLQKYHGWEFKQAANEVRQVLGIHSQPGNYPQPKGPLPNPPPKPPAKPPATAEYARRLWEACNRDDDYVAAHPYAIKKRITGACGAGRGIVSGRVVDRHADCLIIPMRALSGDPVGPLVGIECINGAGEKQSFGKKSLLILGNDLDPALPMVVFEGWASASKWLDSRQWNACGVVSFGKGSGDRVAASLQAHYPDHIVIVAREAD